jgi:Flp pilus assembly protein TadD
MSRKVKSWKSWFAAGIVSLSIAGGPQARAGDLKITLPRRSHMTPVQRLNQEGVEAIHKHSYEKAETYFYKAYLLDPDDPFTLNNLGYISELQGQVDRAQRFYSLAGQMATDAAIDKASSRRLEGRSLKEALAIPDSPLQINHDNVEAVRLLSQGRGPEADLLLQKSLKTGPNNIFTLNNLGVAKEMEGESQEALRYYDSAAAVNSDAAAVVTLNKSWRGKPVAEMAAQNARNLRTRLGAQMTLEMQLTELNTRGVSAINRNELQSAQQDFLKAYALDPNNAFANNNIGYLSEIEGDRETAQFFYDRAQALNGANSPVGLATRSSAEGLRLGQVASDSDAKVEAKVHQERNLRRQQREPILLRRRDNSVVQEPATPPASAAPQQ